jgi:hypothetical protein
VGAFTEFYDWLLGFAIVKSVIGAFSLGGVYAFAKGGWQLVKDRREHVPSFWAELRFLPKNRSVLNLTVRNRSPNDITVSRIDIETPSFSGIGFADTDQYKDNIALHLPPGPPILKDVPSETVSFEMIRAAMMPRAVTLHISVFAGPTIDDEKWRSRRHELPHWLWVLGLKFHGFWYSNVKAHGWRVYRVPVNIIQTHIYEDEA